jgi:hypothetical protein
MKQFLTRVELHGASLGDYLTLQAEMARLKFSRTITADNGQVHHLPTAEYRSFGYITVAEVAALAKGAANLTGKASSVITVEYSAAFFYLDNAFSPLASLSSLLRP